MKKEKRDCCFPVEEADFTMEDGGFLEVEEEAGVAGVFFFADAGAILFSCYRCSFVKPSSGG